MGKKVISNKIGLFPFLLTFLILCSINDKIFAVNDASTIISKAIGYLGTPITDPLPSPYTGFFNCSGLVSVCAGLDRVYTVENCNSCFNTRGKNIQRY